MYDRQADDPRNEGGNHSLRQFVTPKILILCCRNDKKKIKWVMDSNRKDKKDR